MEWWAEYDLAPHVVPAEALNGRVEVHSMDRTHLSDSSDRRLRDLQRGGGIVYDLTSDRNSTPLT